MPRHQRILSQTGIYHIMMRGNERKNLFVDDEDKQRFIETLFNKKTEAGFFVYAYCLMDNHVHLLLREGPNNLAIMMKRINTSYAYYFNQKYNRVGHLFQDRFKSEPIEDDRQLLTVVRYIHNNPVKAGMVEGVDLYKWSSYHNYIFSQRTDAVIVDTELILAIMADDPQKAIEEFKVFSLETDQSRFLDTDEEHSWTLEEGKSYLQDYIALRWPDKNIENLMIHKDSRNEIIVYLKENTKLSVRSIASLLGINRGMVQKTKAAI